jgi:hypothetical protein
MSTNGFDQVVDRVRNDPAFRDEMRSDPEGTIQRANVTLTEDERHRLQRIDWNLPDEHLEEQLRKASERQ